MRLRAQGFVGGGRGRYHPDLGGAPRKPLDAYPTPAPVTQALVNVAPPPPGLLREPACGRGDMARVLEANGWPVVASDIRSTGYGEGGVDYLAAPPLPGVVGIVTNPPFRLAAAFIRKAVQEAPYVALLLKSTYWHAGTRAPLFREHPPSLVLPLTWRVAFLEKERGTSPMMDVTWFVWDRRLSGEPIYRLLDKPGYCPALHPLLEPAMADLGDVVRRIVESVEARRAGG